MKRLVLSLSALLAAPAVASAADLPERAAPAVAWSGFYAGGHGAWLTDGGAAERLGVAGVPAAALPPRLGLSASGLGGGAQVGYLWQAGSLVAGLEADVTALEVGRSRRFDGDAGAFAVGTELRSQLTWFGTVKGRVGVALPSLLPVVRQTLVYVTGGLAYARIEHRGQITVTPPGLGPQAGGAEWTTGFAVGGGSEHALTPRVSLKSETLYYKLADETLTLARAGDQARYRFHNDGWISRLGLNVRF